MRGLTIVQCVFYHLSTSSVALVLGTTLVVSGTTGVSSLTTGAV